MQSPETLKKVPTAITLVRVFLSPLFFAVFAFPALCLNNALAQVISLWVIFTIMELSDLFDGMAARKYGATSDFGKVFDPFADSFSRLSYFACFAITGLMPALAFLLVMYRDLLVNFGRLLVAREGVSMSARVSGKIKAGVYAVAGGAGIAYKTLGLFSPPASITTAAGIVLTVFFWICAATAVWTTIDYLVSVAAFLKSKKAKP